MICNYEEIGIKLDRICLRQDIKSFIQRNVVNLCIVYDLNTWLRHLLTEFALVSCLFEL